MKEQRKESTFTPNPGIQIKIMATPNARQRLWFKEKLLFGYL
ncbi:MAG TPA: hypothetical protein VGO45_08395 [Bacteroidia bacterium]|nr:hypothetical protein [Bacteroidia bacterium]